jgi:hypothetical protein
MGLSITFFSTESNHRNLGNSISFGYFLLKSIFTKLSIMNLKLSVIKFISCDPSMRDRRPAGNLDENFP